MPALIEVALVVVTWLAASLAALGGGARQRAAAVAVAALATGGLVAGRGQPEAAALIAAGGLAGAALIARPAGRGAGVATGSAPVITLCVIIGVLAAWLGGSLLGGSGGGAVRTVALLLVGLGTARLVAGPSGQWGAPALLLVLGCGAAAAFDTPPLAGGAGAAAGAVLVGLAARRPAVAT